MKKIMIGILVLIPIIIIATVGAVTRFVTTRAHIAVESISFNFEEGESKNIDLAFGKEYYTDFNETIGDD
ncbi:MAG: hypothetical protein MJ193_02805, partial [Clostridia bacterium]|nr:hypothetical protein [Clostridia bacterium]